MQSDSSPSSVSQSTLPNSLESPKRPASKPIFTGPLAAMLLVFAGSFLRCPSILLHGRVWAEESSIFLAGNWHLPFVKILLASQFGYFSIWDNFFAAVAVHWLPLTLTSLLFTWSGVLLLLATAWFVYQAEFLPTPGSKMLAMLPLLLTAPSLETWLNLINSEFYFGACAAVILASSASRLRWARGLMLALTSLSGPLTTLLVPLFVLRALLRRQRGEIVQAAIVCAGALAEVAVALISTTANRQVRLNFIVLGPVLFNKQVILPFLDRFSAKAISIFLVKPAHQSVTIDLAAWMLFLFAMACLFWLLRGSNAALQLLAAAIWLAILEQVLALNGGLALVGPGYGERYSFTPNFLLGLVVVVGATTLAARPRQRVARVLLVLFFVAGIPDYLLLPLRKGFYQGEPWRQQALRWEHDPAQPLYPLPKTFGPIHLTKEH